MFAWEAEQEKHKSSFIVMKRENYPNSNMLEHSKYIQSLLFPFLSLLMVGIFMGKEAKLLIVLVQDRGEIEFL